MSFIFISHAAVDKPRVKPIVDALLQAGFSIWLDNPVAAGFDSGDISKFHRIRAGKRWEDEIDDAKREAGCILVCWSKTALVDGVLDGKARFTWMGEVDYGRTEKKLVSCTVDDVRQDALPGTASAQQIPCVDPDLPPERFRAASLTVISDIDAIIRKRVTGRTEETAPEARGRAKNVATIHGNDGTVVQAENVTISHLGRGRSGP